MSGDEGKNPDQLLTLIQKTEARDHLGKLKVFLGMAAGVGKTFAMLQSAHQVKSRGIDIVVGLVETHGRSETAALLEGLEILPRKTSEYRGVEIAELDLDAVLARRPKIVLVDELAHTNAPGSRHKKRYLDVMELLDAGIDVFTTLNVQHLESRIDTIQEIAQITVHETIPDSVLDRADEVVLIDLAPDELLKRLSEGRIYAEKNAESAVNHFFKRGNLTALREIALRVAAERVDRELRDYKTLHGIEEVWKTSGRLMVAIFASPYSEVLIRWTRRVADLLGVTWIGAYIENDVGYTDSEKALLAKNIALVQHIGGEIVSTRDDDPVKGLLRLAQQNNVTQIIVGKSQRGFIQSLLSGGSLVNRLLRQSGKIDIYAVSTNRAKGKQYLKRTLKVQKPLLRAEDLGWSIAIALGTWLVAQTLTPWIGYLAVGIVFLIAVSVSGLFLSRFAVFILALAFAVIHNFFFIPPTLTLAISKPEDFMLLLMYFIAAAVVGHLTTRLSQKERVLRSREDRAMLLYGLAKDIAASQTIHQVVERAQFQIENALDVDVTFLLRDFTKAKMAFDSTSQPTSTDKEHAVATWVLENGRMAGHGTDTLAAAEATYIPIIGRSGTLGVARIIAKSPTEALSADLQTLIDTFLHQIAAGIEREIYHDRVKSLLLAEETQKLYKSLLDCVSHELKTPLAAIKGSASALVDPMTSGKKDAVEALGQQIVEAADRLQRLVENLLDMTRIESGMMRPSQTVCDVKDIVATALHSLEAAKDLHPVRVKLGDNIPPVLCDPVLTHQAVVNIIHNAFVYTPSNAPIELSAQVTGEKHVTLIIRDHGQGLPRENPERVLEKFYRAEPHKAGGVGLGLSIAKGFLEAQGGSLHAGNHPDGGAVFSLQLPRGDRA